MSGGRETSDERKNFDEEGSQMKKRVRREKRAFRKDNAFFSVGPGRLADKLLLCVLLIGMAVFILYPIFCMVRDSLYLRGVFSLERYRGLLQANSSLLANSLLVALFTSLLSTLFSVATAISIFACSGRRKMFLQGFLLVTMVSPPFVSSLAYIQLFGRRGLITWHLLGLSFNPYGWHGIVLMQSLSFAPLGGLFLLGMLNKVGGKLPDASRDLGASPAKTLLHVVLPLIRPAIWACLLLAFIRSLADFGTPIVIGGRFDVLASEIYLQIIGYADLGKASALNLMILIPVAILFLGYRSLLKRSDRMLHMGDSGGFGEGESARVCPGGIIGVLVWGCSGLFFVAMGLQYLTIFAGGFIKSVKGTYSVTLDNLDQLLTYDTDTLIRSVVYGLIVGIGGTLFAMLLSYYIERRSIPLRGTVDFVATMPYMIPGICFGIGYILAFNHPPLRLTGTAAIVILNMLFKQLPNSTKICSASLSQIPVTWEEAARDAGAGRLHVLKDIILPNMNRAFVTGFIYNFTSAMTTGGAILFLINPGKKVAVFRLFDAINTGEYGVASLLSTCIILITLVVNLAVPWLAQTLEKGRGTYVRDTGKPEQIISK